MDLTCPRVCSGGWILDVHPPESRGGWFECLWEIDPHISLTPLDIMICNKLGAVFPAAAGAFFSAKKAFPGFWEHAPSEIIHMV